MRHLRTLLATLLAIVGATTAMATTATHATSAAVSAESKLSSESLASTLALNAAAPQPNQTADDLSAYAVLSGSTLTFYYDTQRYSRSGTKFDANYTGDSGWFIYAEDRISEVVFDASFNNYHGLTNAYRMFSLMWRVTEIQHLEYLHTENVTNMSYMFSGCEQLASLDVSGFNTAQVTNMTGMFSGCEALTSLDVSGFNTSQVRCRQGSGVQVACSRHPADVMRHRFQV